ncbi:STM4012 family radical SAM protein [Chryseolinea sp. T2]|uniref:STM4012 family radical SAM protein n=1 Tax=Chryseolinea sp. T2 TaxID=3129255 RepID=UPI0030788D48
MNSIGEKFLANPYQGYAYSYPHKTSYRPFIDPLPLENVWSDENHESLFLYLHIPFCEMRCGFCNLFTMANPHEGKVGQYLHALERQARVVRSVLGDAKFSQLAVGGGTPSFLEENELERLFSIIEDTMGARPSDVPMSFEVSPKTVTKAKLKYLFDRGVDRVSIGIQSFLEEESKLLGRSQRNTEVFHALDSIKEQGFPTLNIDLIYGGAGQTSATWKHTLNKTLSFDPGEIYLYPLYVRPLTGLEKMGMSWDNHRLQLYREGRDLLLSNGYEQVSMRMFRKRQGLHQKNSIGYCCQEDGMVGLGSGARSYTRRIHYSSEYAVGRKGVMDIINHYTHETDEAFSFAHYGICLNNEEQKRRYMIKSLLHGDGLNEARYRNMFTTDVMTDFPQLPQLLDAGMAYVTGDDEVKLTMAGMELSDSIGPWLYSEDVYGLMNVYELR